MMQFCAYGATHTQEYIDAEKLLWDNKKEQLYCYCENNNLDDLIIEINCNNELFKKIWTKLFIYACSCGSLDIVKWIWSKTNEIKKMLRVNTRCLDEEDTNTMVAGFHRCCTNHYMDVEDQLKILKFIHKKYSRAHFSNRRVYMFYTICTDKKIKLAKYLFKIENEYKGNNNFEKIYDWTQTHNLQNIFIDTCENNQLETAKWLYSIKDNLNIRINDDCIYKKCRLDNMQKMMEWLQSLDSNLLNLK